MVVLFKNLFEVNKSATAKVHKFFLQWQPLFLETPMMLTQQPQAATHASYISTVEQVINLSGCSSYACQLMSSNWYFHTSFSSFTG